jgi:hypothetical protein
MLSKILDVPISYFFEDMPDSVRGGKDDSVDLPASSSSSLSDEEILKLVRVYYRIRDPKLRARLLELCKSLGRDAN